MATSGPSRDRGSRKHVLDLLEGGEFKEKMAEIFTGTEIHLAPEPQPQPINRSDRAAWSELDVEGYLKQRPVTAWNGLFPSDWWVKGRGTRPTWDLLCHILVGERPGLLLVEAKAHEGELDWDGKRLSSSAKVASKDNHDRIAGCIRQASDALNRICDGVFNLHVDSHYQLANRVAYTWKLASLGLPVVLLYLGFHGDRYFDHDYIRSPDHWQRVMGGYLEGVVSQQFPEQAFSLEGGGTLKLLIRSLKVAEVSNLKR